MTLIDKLKLYKIRLASASPRRQFLLREMGIEFSVQATDTDESYDAHLSPEEVAVYLSQKKAAFFDAAQLDDNELIITADTLVSLHGQIIPKPATEAEAEQFLRQLSGNMHEVFTGVTLKSKSKTKTFMSSSKVYFKKLSDDEIRYYLSICMPLDKAGAYGIQEWIGYIGIERIEGSFYNVMGLPTAALYRELGDFML